MLGLLMYHGEEKVETVEKEPKKRGRPLGSKNKKILLREKKEYEKLNLPSKRKPGRPMEEGT